MKITRLNSDYIEVNEENIYDDNLLSIPRVHLIKFSFINPDEILIGNVLKLYQKTNRFVIENNIRIYNYILKSTNKKYYVENKKGTSLISFFRKNNKVLVNFLNLTDIEQEFLLSVDCLVDLLKHTEVIKINKEIFDEKEEVLKNWSGNVIII